MIIKIVMTVALLSLSLVTQCVAAHWLSPWQFAGVQWSEAHEQEHNGVTLHYANFESELSVIALASQFSQATPKVFHRLLTLPQQVIMSGIGKTGEHWLAVIHAVGKGSTGYLSSMRPPTQELDQSLVQSPASWWQPQGLTPVLTHTSPPPSPERYQQLFALPHCTVRAQHNIRKQLETQGWKMTPNMMFSEPIQVWQRQRHQIMLIPLKLAQGCGLYVVQQQEKLP